MEASQTVTRVAVESMTTIAHVLAVDDDPSVRQMITDYLGDNDIRVPKEEAEQVVKILQDAEKTVDAHYYPNEGHGFAKQAHEIQAFEAKHKIDQPWLF